MIELDLYSTLVVASMVLILGQFLVARISVIRKYSIPEPVVGGLVVALILFALHSLSGTSVRFLKKFVKKFGMDEERATSYELRATNIFS